MTLASPTSVNPSSDTTKTLREHLITVAARHFAEFGMEGASQRAIQREAGVNAASTHYHFGSKKDLYRAVIEAALTRIQEERQTSLELLHPDVELPRVERARAVLQAYLAPHLRGALTDIGYSYTRILANLQVSRPDAAADLIEKFVAPVRDQYLDALGRVYPHVSRHRIDEVLVLMMGLTANAPLHVDQVHLSPEIIERLISDVVVAATASFEALCSGEHC